MDREAGAVYYLDFRNNELYGWEERKSKSVVASIAEQILNGQDIPPVKVFQRSNGIYELSSADGGHNRALAYFILRRSLPVIFSESPLEEPTPVNVRKIKLVEDLYATKFDQIDKRMNQDSKYIPYSGNNDLINKRINLFD
jgi:hypothetical protein